MDRLFGDRGLGISRFVSLGNQADIGLVELIEACAADEHTEAIAVYVEDLRDGRGFVEAAAAAAVEAGTPVVVLAAGASTAGARGAQSHTGSLTSDAAVVAAACRAAGVTQVRTPRALADVLMSLRQRAQPRGRRVAVLTDGGGHGVIACDVLEAVGLEVPALEPATQGALSEALWAQSSVTNPVDLAGAGEMDPQSYARAFAALQQADDVDAILMTGYFGGYSGGEDGLIGLGPAECAAAKQLAVDAAGRKPVAVQSMFPESPACRILADGRGAGLRRRGGRCGRPGGDGRGPAVGVDAGDAGTRPADHCRRLLVGAGGLRGSGRPVRGRPRDPLGGRAARGGPGAASAVRPEGAGAAAQVGRRRGRGRAARPRGPLPRVRAADRAAGTDPPSRSRSWPTWPAVSS